MQKTRIVETETRIETSLMTWTDSETQPLWFQPFWVWIIGLNLCQLTSRGDILIFSSLKGLFETIILELTISMRGIWQGMDRPATRIMHLLCKWWNLIMKSDILTARKISRSCLWNDFTKNGFYLEELKYVHLPIELTLLRPTAPCDFLRVKSAKNSILEFYFR